MNLERWGDSLKILLVISKTIGITCWMCDGEGDHGVEFTTL
jgi:hypothetical protein